MSHTNFNVQPDEQTLLQIRKHWFMFFRDAIGIVLIGVLVPIVGSIALGAFDTVSGSLAALFIFGMATWLLCVWIAVAVMWTNHYLDMWVITDHRIIHTEQKYLFVRETTTIPLERVQDARVLYNGFLQTMLDFGTIHVQSAGADEHEVMMTGMPQPNEVKRLILEWVDKFREAHVYTRTTDDTSWHNQHH